MYKKDCPSLASKYRPIAFTSIASKVKNQLSEIVLCCTLLKNNLLSVHQHGFGKGHSTWSQLLECLNYFTSALEESDCLDVRYIDFKRAFDSVSIPKLIHKLSAFSISGCMSLLAV